MYDLPGIVSTTRMETTESARARSFIRLTIWAPLTPTAGSISKRVITGPGYAASTRHRDAEIGELALDQARSELERLGAHRLLRRRRVVEQRERRQRRIGHVDEERPLLFLHGALGSRHLDERRHDDDRLVHCVLVLQLHDRFALGDCLRAELAVLALLVPGA